MSTAMRRIFFTHMCQSYSNNLIRRSVILKTNGKFIQKRSMCAISKNNIPNPEPGKFQAAILNKSDNSLVIQNMELFKSVLPNEVVIDVHYCAINPSDILLTKNMPMHESKLPVIPGYELVGELVQVGKHAQDKGYKTGDKVIALNKERYGGFAEQCVADVCDIWKIPSNIDSLDAACLLNDYMTALIALERIVSINETDTILINVGLNSSGLAAVDLATNIFKSQVTGICINNEDTALVRNKGVYASLAYDEQKLMKHIKKIAKEKDIKTVFDGDSGEYLKKTLKCFTDIYKNGISLQNNLREDNFAVIVHHLSREGRVIFAGAATTKIKEDLGSEDNYFKITGFDLTEYRRKHLDTYRQAGEEVLEFYEEDLITPTHSAIIGLHKINDALSLSSNPKTSAKVIVDIKNKEINGLKASK